MITLSIEKFKTTIGDLTEIARVQKNLEDDVEKIEICDVIEDIKVLMAQEIKLSEATINVDTNECPTLSFSKKNIKSVIFNLLNNSIKYRSPERKPVINIATSKLDDFVVLTISDNGLGIEEKHKDKIFGMFKRAHQHVEGTGMGLYIVKRIIDNTGGRIEVESIVNQGTTFKLYIKSE